MLDFSIHIKDKEDVTIAQNTKNLEDTMYSQKKRDIVKDEYISLVKQLKQLNAEKIVSKDTPKAELSCLDRWKIGKVIVDFIITVNNEAINVPNLSHALGKSIGGDAVTWDLHQQFYSVNPNKEYIGYPWWVCMNLSGIVNPLTREILIDAYKDKKINYEPNERKNKGLMQCFWKPIIENGDVGKIPNGRKRILDMVKKKDVPVEKIMEKFSICYNSVEKRVEELSNLHLYNITIKNKICHLEPNDEERKKIEENIKQEVKKIKEEIQNRSKKIEPKNI